MIKVTDLTEIHECGNGLLSLKTCEWSNREDDIYKLRFVGEYALDSFFEFIGVYQMSVRDGEKTFTLNDSVFSSSERID